MVSDTTFKTLSLHYMVRLIGGRYSPVLEAIKELGLRGRIVNGERLWTHEEFVQIKKRAEELIFGK